jgi:hypothetical protein
MAPSPAEFWMSVLPTIPDIDVSWSGLWRGAVNEYTSSLLHSYEMMAGPSMWLLDEALGIEEVSRLNEPPLVGPGGDIDLGASVGHGAVMVGTHIAGELAPETEAIPYQWHHFASDKSTSYTPAFEKIASKYGLGLDEPWNKELMQHLGRHPDEYHEFVLNAMREADLAARGDVTRFLQEFEMRVKSVVRNNPGMLRKWWWE